MKALLSKVRSEGNMSSFGRVPYVISKQLNLDYLCSTLLFTQVSSYNLFASL